MKDFFFFNKMFTPNFITFIYWLLILGSIIGGLITMFSGYQGLTGSTFFFGLLTMIGGVIFSRIWCELLIVLFKMNDALQELCRK